MASIVQPVRDSLAQQKANRMVRKVAKESTKTRDQDIVNPRVWNMFREAVEFKANTIVPFQKGLGDVETATLNFFEGVLPLLRAPLPRVWDTVEGGLAEPIRATISHHHPNIAGGDIKEPAMRASVGEYETRLQLKVRRPLAQWSDALETVRVRFPELERLRHNLESRAAKVSRQEKKAEKELRKALGVKRGSKGLTAKGKGRRNGGHTGVSGLLYRCTHPGADEPLVAAQAEYDYREPASAGAVSGGGAGGVASEEGGVSRIPGTGLYETGVDDDVMAREFKREEQDIKLKDRQRKLEVAREAFAQEESLLYEQLSGLCRDAAWTKSYVAAALLMTKELYQEAVYNLGETLQPLPACKSLSSARGLGEEMTGPAAGVTGGSVIEGVEVPPAVSGRLGSNMVYNAAMPDFATRARARTALDELRLAAAKRQHAHRSTASPLELHAFMERGDRASKATSQALQTTLAPPTPEMLGALRAAIGGGAGTPTPRQPAGQSIAGGMQPVSVA